MRFLDFGNGFSELETRYIAIFLALSVILYCVNLKGYLSSLTLGVVGRLIVLITAAAQLLFDLKHGTFWEHWYGNVREDRCLPFVFVVAFIGFGMIARGYDATRKNVTWFSFSDEQYDEP